MKRKKFEIVGAGEIIVGNFGSWCGNAYGLHFEASWGGKYGGVLGKEEALKLAHHIIEQCQNVKETEQQLIKVASKNLFKQQP